MVQETENVISIFASMLKIKQTTLNLVIYETILFYLNRCLDCQHKGFAQTPSSANLQLDETMQQAQMQKSIALISVHPIATLSINTIKHPRIPSTTFHSPSELFQCGDKSEMTAGSHLQTAKLARGKTIYYV